MLVDLTADDTAAALEQALTHGMDLVLANKRPLADRRAVSDALWQTARARGRRILHEATVGAGLPIIDTYHKLVESGDRVDRIEGLLSGTLGYVLSQVSGGSRRSRARCEARWPRAIPSPIRGTISRAWMSAGRRSSWRGCWATRASCEQSAVESLVPKWARALPLAEFVGRLPGARSAWKRRVEAAAARGLGAPLRRDGHAAEDRGRAAGGARHEPARRHQGLGQPARLHHRRGTRPTRWSSPGPAQVRR